MLEVNVVARMGRPRKAQQFVDALNPSLQADESVELAIDGTTYQWWLAEENAIRLRAWVNDWMEHLESSQDSERAQMVVRLDSRRRAVRPTGDAEHRFLSELEPWVECARISHPKVVRLVPEA